jgi:hypothetical protein
MENDIIVKKQAIAISNQKLSSWLIGLGIVLFVWHNPYQPLLQYAFLPWIGTIMLIIGIILTLTAKSYKLDMGQKRVWIPLAIISVSIALSGIFNGAWQGAVSLAVMFFGLYLTTRVLGKEILEKIAPWVVVIESISIPIWGATHSWSTNGGLLSPTNYDIATGVIVFFTLLAKPQQRWWLATVGTIGLIFSGSAEAFLVGGILFVIVVIRKLMGNIKESWLKIMSPVIALSIIALVTIPIGYFVEFQAPNMQRLSWLRDMTGWDFIPHIDMTGSTRDPSLDNILGQRFTHWKLSPIKPFGYGINLTHFYYGIPHNIFLIIIEQVGILAMIAWCVVAFQGIKNRKWRYVWIGFLLLGLVDHFIFTQAAPFYWILAGITFMKEKTDAINESGTQEVTILAEAGGNGR